MDRSGKWSGYNVVEFTCGVWAADHTWRSSRRWTNTSLRFCRGSMCIPSDPGLGQPGPRLTPGFCRMYVRHCLTTWACLYFGDLCGLKVIHVFGP